jgi:amidase
LSDPRSQIGPLSRWVEDLGLALEQIAGEDGHDAGVVPVPFARDQETTQSTLRLACYTHEGFAEPTEATVATIAQAARALAPVCRSVEEATPPALDLAREVTLAYWRFSRLTGREIEQWMARWDTFRTAMLHFMAQYDLLLCPAAPSPAVPHGQKDIDLQFSYALPFSLTGQPSVVVRVGTSPEGLPIGVQITARRWREVDALVVAQHLEIRFGGWRPPIIETEKS